ncbi:hypothetical protein CC1G_01909 [Coprinopsis cinerea okayama7|uniref:Uncharacterized protein n=1 Tax=Coprinopsis cinerea (strain Okayama-7 / 130 / ATCC MYA-4618 / FGSC 9003) TaxID=240176 RepID=A8N5X8_COPC7|nr:hypothetical protein CC1G_01909 [Coprinopsis cinerea okayama7\|eukprot:XP_001830273.1 hypothetical protein CC1G_01909 [Coprinopsis cinerea okayama7\
MFKRSLVVVSALAAYVSAQTDQPSDQCTAALSQIALNPEAASCLNTVPLISVLTGNSSSPLLPTLKTWITGMCNAAPCSNETLAAVVQNVTTGCAEDFAAYNLTEDGGGVLTTIQQYYPTVRKVLCLQESGDNCVVKTVEAVEAKVGELTLDNIIATGLNSSLIASDIICTDCVKAAYNIVVQDIPQLGSGGLTGGAESLCGANFTDGDTPENISESSNEESSTDGDSGDAQNVYLGLAASSVAAISTVFTLFL